MIFGTHYHNDTLYWNI